MGLLDAIAELIAPTRCAGCDLPGALLCDDCRVSLPRIDPGTACPRCGAPYGVLVCTECWSTEFAFEGAIALAEFAGSAARAVVLHKDASERRLGELLGRLLAEDVARTWPGWADAVCWVPATAAAIARRGFDHSEAIARPVSIALEAPLRSLLARERAADQRTLGRAGRLSAAAGSFKSSSCPDRVIVVDDVFTTGATTEAAAHALLSAGAAAVRAVVVARAW